MSKKKNFQKNFTIFKDVLILFYIGFKKKILLVSKYIYIYLFYLKMFLIQTIYLLKCSFDYHVFGLKKSQLSF